MTLGYPDDPGCRYSSSIPSYRWKLKSSGEPAVVKMVHEWTMDGGKAVAFQQHVDIVRVRELS